MGTGAKIAIGCGCLVLLGAAAVLDVVGAGAWWAKGKIEDASAGLDKMTAQAETSDSLLPSNFFTALLALTSSMIARFIPAWAK